MKKKIFSYFELFISFFKKLKKNILIFLNIFFINLISSININKLKTIGIKKEKL